MWATGIYALHLDMRYWVPFVLLFLCLACQPPNKTRNFSSVRVEMVYSDSVSIRAIDFLDQNTLAFAGSNGIYGTVTVPTNTIRTNVMTYDTLVPAFRAVAHTNTDFFMLSVASPALLYKTGDGGKMELVYTEEGEGVFYDAMKFWNDSEGIAFGDTVGDCVSILITRDGGNTWRKLDCGRLPKPKPLEGAFAASNTNIEIKGDVVWIATSAGRVYSSPDRGQSWTVTQTPIVNEKDTQGIYSLVFYDKDLGYGYGGDFTAPGANENNVIRTTDGGLTWHRIASKNNPGYKSCVQVIPGTEGKGLVAVGFTGISYSNNGGENWKNLSDQGFFTLRFLDEYTAYAAGRNRIAKLRFE